MYTIRQIIKGIRDPGLIKREMNFAIDSCRNFDYAVSGAYWTGNIGDRAIADSFERQISKTENSSRLIPSKIGKTRSNVHVLGGGGILRDCRAAINGNKAEVLENQLNWVSKLGKGAIIGVGVPGFKLTQSKELVESRLTDVELITVRDKWSYEKLKKYCNNDIYLTACPAFLLEDPEVPLQNHTGVNFRPWPNYPANIMSYYFDYSEDMVISQVKEKYINNIQIICDEIENPVFIPFHKEDEVFAKNNLDIKTLSYEFSVEKTLKRISSVNKMVSMRYHSLIFSAITNTPVLVLAYQPKVSYLAARLGVSSYKPHEEDIPLNFETPSNLERIRDHASNNFDLLKKI